MEILRINLTANIPYRLPLRGRYFRILNGTGDFDVKTSSGMQSMLLAGLGVDLLDPNTGEHFSFVDLTADSTQEVTVSVSDFPITDSRLTGDIDINGLLSVATVGGNSITETSGTLAHATAGTLLAADTDRIETTVYIDQDIFVSGTSPASTASFPLPAGYHTFKNTAAVYMYNNSGATLNYKTFGDNK